jgi:hypothetical protein
VGGDGSRLPEASHNDGRSRGASPQNRYRPPERGALAAAPDPQGGLRGGGCDLPAGHRRRTSPGSMGQVVRPTGRSTWPLLPGPVRTSLADGEIT